MKWKQFIGGAWALAATAGLLGCKEKPAATRPPAASTATAPAPAVVLTNPAPAPNHGFKLLTANQPAPAPAAAPASAVTSVVVEEGTPFTTNNLLLYNGLRLLAGWPPRKGQTPPEPMAVPYLTNPPAVIPIDVGRQLFVDDFLIEQTTLKRTYHQAELYTNNPVLKPDQPWEMEGKAPMAMVFSDGVWFDPQDKLFKMWYMGGYTRYTCYATSTNGVDWDKPKLDVRPGSNIVLPESRDSSTVWLDQSDPDPKRRFKLFRTSNENNQWGVSIHFSPDGIHWDPRAVRTGPTGDRTTVFWNPFRGVWVYSLRSAWAQPRMRSYWENTDPVNGLQWNRPDQPLPWFGADKLDLPRADLQETPQLYNLDAVAYENLFVGLFTIWRGDKNIPAGRPKPNSVSLGFSRDGYHWHRPDRTPFIPVSEKQGDWNWGNVQSAGGGFLVWGRKLYFYFSGRAGAPDQRDAGGATGLATLRRDGFASMDADAEPGTLTTRPVKWRPGSTNIPFGKYLFVNANVTNGVLQTEILDEHNQPIEPFTKANSQPIANVDPTLTLANWTGAVDLSALAGRTVKFRFHLTKGNLYSFWVSPSLNGASRGFMAAGGPHFSSPLDTVGNGSYRPFPVPPRPVATNAPAAAVTNAPATNAPAKVDAPKQQ